MTATKPRKLKILRQTAGIVMLFVMLAGFAGASAPMTESSRGLAALFDMLGAMRQSADKPAYGRLARRYLNRFPGRFAEFVDVFGYREHERHGLAAGAVRFGPLYDHSHDHIRLFFSLYEHVPKSLFIEKTVNLTQDAEWQVDAVSEFQTELARHIAAHETDYIDYLARVDKATALGLLRFFTLRLHPRRRPSVRQLCKQAGFARTVCIATGITPRPQQAAGKAGQK